MTAFEPFDALPASSCLGELVRRVEHRRQARADHVALLEFRIVRDLGDVVANLVDDRLRRAGRRIDAEEGRRQICVVAVSRKVGIRGPAASACRRRRRSPDLPAADDWIRLPMPKIAIGVVPVSMLLTASPPPLNGTRTKSMPCSLLKLLHERHLGQRRPPCSSASSGLALASAASSSKFFDAERGVHREHLLR